MLSTEYDKKYFDHLQRMTEDIDRKVTGALTRCWATVPDTSTDDAGRGQRCFKVAMSDSDYCEEHQGEEPLV